MGHIDEQMTQFSELEDQVGDREEIFARFIEERGIDATELEAYAKAAQLAVAAQICGLETAKISILETFRLGYEVAMSDVAHSFSSISEIEALGDEPEQLA